MNNETHEDRVKILAGAPDVYTGLSFYDGHYYVYDKGVWFVWVYVWFACLGMNECKRPKNGIRSLADVKKLVDMQNEIDELKCRVLTLEDAATQTIGWVESTNGCIESIRMLLNVMDKD